MSDFNSSADAFDKLLDDFIASQLENCEDVLLESEMNKKSKKAPQKNKANPPQNTAP